MLSPTPFYANERQLDRYFAQMLNDLTHHFIPDQQAVYHRQPDYTYEADGNSTRVDVELPGVVKENVSIDLHGNKLVVNAKRFKNNTIFEQAPENKTDKPQSENVEKKSEQTNPSVIYELKLRIDHNYDADNLEAFMRGDGILKIHIPMKKDSPRIIQIH